MVDKELPGLVNYICINFIQKFSHLLLLNSSLLLKDRRQVLLKAFLLSQGLLTYQFLDVLHIECQCCIEECNLDCRAPPERYFLEDAFVIGCLVRGFFCF